MAKIQQEYLIIKLSKLVKQDAVSSTAIVDPAIISGLETIVEELINDETVVVEIDTDASIQE